MNKYYYYEGNWDKGFTSLGIFVGNTILEADKKFETKHGISAQTKGISVTLKPKIGS